MELYDFHSFFNLSFERHFEVVHCRGNAVSGYLLSFETKSLLRLEEEKINHVGIQSCLKKHSTVDCLFIISVIKEDNGRNTSPQTWE